jgi:hypothetical protein
MSQARSVELTRAPVFLLLPPGAAQDLIVVPAPAKETWRHGKPCPVVLQLVGRGDVQHSAFRLGNTKQLQLIAYNFGIQPVKGQISVEGAVAESNKIEIAPIGRVVRTLTATGADKIIARLKLGELGQAVVCGRVMMPQSPSSK